jgi:predicted DNA-binding protein
MSKKMLPKQIRLTQQQNFLLKRLAKERGVSESEVIRQVLEHEILRAGLEGAKPKR